MTTVEIEYCVPCGQRDRAMDLQDAILAEYGLEVDSVSLKTGDGGVFKIHVNDELVFDKDEDEFDEAHIVESVREHGLSGD